MFFNIGIKHGFPCINICQVPWEVLKTEAEDRVTGHMLMHKKIMFDRYYCINTFCVMQENSIILKKMRWKFLYSATEFPRKGHVHGMCFDYAASRA